MGETGKGMDLRDRLNAITVHQLGGRGRFKELAEASRIGMDSWKNTWHKKQRPTTEMVQFVARAWPQFAFWLATGITDMAHGHQAPESSENFLETMYRTRDSAEPYFRRMIGLLESRERGKPELATHFVELRELRMERESAEFSAAASNSMREAATLVLAAQELDSGGERGKPEAVAVDSTTDFARALTELDRATADIATWMTGSMRGEQGIGAIPQPLLIEQACNRVRQVKAKHAVAIVTAKELVASR